jgi:hypothetical protein
LVVVALHFFNELTKVHNLVLEELLEPVSIPGRVGSSRSEGLKDIPLIIGVGCLEGLKWFTRLNLRELITRFIINILHEGSDNGLRLSGLLHDRSLMVLNYLES